MQQNYDYIHCNYLHTSKDTTDKLAIYNPLIQIIKKQIQKETSSTSIEKWVIFVSNKEKGQSLLEKIGTDHATFITSESKQSNGADHIALEEIVAKESFSKKVLIATSVLDSGINLKDKKIKHIVISTFDKVSFLQMLGRVRHENNSNSLLNLYILEYTGRTINYLYQNIKSKLARIYEAQDYNNHYKILQDIFAQDDLFFFIPLYSIQTPFIGYNHFCKLKLEADFKFSARFQKVKKATLPSDKDSLTATKNNLPAPVDTISFDTYIKHLPAIRGYKDEEIMELLNEESNLQFDIGETTIREQLSWIGQENTFDVKNYIKSTDETVSTKENEDAFFTFLNEHALMGKTLDDTYPEDTSLDIYFENLLIYKNDQPNFSEKFTDLFKKAFGPRNKDKAQRNYGLTIIRQCLSDLSYDKYSYKLNSKSFTFPDNDEGNKHDLKSNQSTVWLLEKSPFPCS